MAVRRGDAEYVGSHPDGFAQTGDIITENVGETSLQFGDGFDTGILQFRVTAFSQSENWLIGEALNPGTTDAGILHTYAGPGPYVAEIYTGARISALNNRASGQYRLQTSVDPFAGNRSPVSTMVPVANIPESPSATFKVPGSDPDGDGIRFRLSTEDEATGGVDLAHPPGLSIDLNTGVMTWNNTGLDQGNFWTTQVVIEDLDGSGNVKTKTPVDFMMRVVAQVGNPPVCEINPPGPFEVTLGQPVSFTVTGTDPDGGILELNTGGLPGGATMTPGLPISGQSGINSTFNWTPQSGDEGSYEIIFSVTDDHSNQSLCSASIKVVSGPPPAPHVVIEPEEVNFGGVVIGRRHVGQVQIRNDGDAPAMISGISGPQGGQSSFFDVFFEVSFPYTLQPGGELIVDVGFSPGDDAQYNSFFDVFIVGEEPRIVNIYGQGLPRAYVPEKINFGYVYTGQTLSTVVYVTNQSDYPITISGFSEPQGEQSSFFDVFFEVSLPHTLQPGEWLAIHASFSPGQDILYNSFFDIFTNEPAHPELRVGLCGQGVRPYSMIHFVDAFGSPGGHAVVDVVVNTDQWFAGLQFKIQPYCNGNPSWYVHFNGLINDLESDGWTASFHTDQNGVTTVLFFHTGGGSLSPYEDHRILELVFDIDPNIPFGKWIDLVTWEVVLSNPSSQPIAFNLWQGTIHIGHPGDIAGGQLGGGDGHADILDIIKLVKKLIGLLPQPEWGSFDFFLCDVNGDGYINILDLVALINDVLESGPQKVIADGPTRPVTVSLADVQTLAGGQLAVPVTLSANGSVAGVQATFTFDAAQLQLGTPQLIGAAAGMTLQSQVVDGKLQVIVYSATGQVIPAGSGAMLVIPATLLGEGSPELTLAEVLLADRGAQGVPVVLGTSTVKVAPLPTAFALKSARPNPFNPTTRVAYDVPKQAHIVVAVYNLLGQEVIRLVDAEQQPGRYEVVWSGRNAQGLSVASGVYLYRLTSSSGFSETKRMTLLK